jgi:hypothetical protein
MIVICLLCAPFVLSHISSTRAAADAAMTCCENARGALSVLTDKVSSAPSSCGAHARQLLHFRTNVGVRKQHAAL